MKNQTLSVLIKNIPGRIFLDVKLSQLAGFKCFKCEEPALYPQIKLHHNLKDALFKPSHFEFIKTPPCRTALPVRTRARAASSSSSIISSSADDEDEGIDDLEGPVGSATGSPPLLEGAGEAEASLPSPNKQEPTPPEQRVCLSSVSIASPYVTGLFYPSACFSGTRRKGPTRRRTSHPIPRRRKPRFLPAPEASPYHPPEARSPPQTRHPASRLRVHPLSPLQLGRGP